MQEIKSDVIKEIRLNLGGSTNIVFSFDCTGSMLPCITQVRQKMRDLVESMTADIPGIKIGLISHGDYCDGDNCIATLDLTSDIEKIMFFINNTPNVNGGDLPECYELALNQACHMSWPVEGGSLILIGDAEPHSLDYPENTDHLDWHEELKALKAKNVNVFALQCLRRACNSSNLFWEQLSSEAGTPLLILENFEDAATTLEATVYASAGSEIYKNYMYKNASSPVVACFQNLCSNRDKLEAWTNTKLTSETMNAVLRSESCKYTKTEVKE